MVKNGWLAIAVIALGIVFGTLVPKEASAYVSDEVLYGMSEGIEGWLFDYSANAYSKEPARDIYEEFINTYGNDYKIRTVIEGLNYTDTTEVHFVLSNVPIELVDGNTLKTSDGSDFVVLNYNDFQIENISKETTHTLTSYKTTFEKKTAPVETALRNLPIAMLKQASTYVQTGLLLLSILMGVLLVKRITRVFFQA